MQRFIIERDVPGIGRYTPEQISDILAKTRAAIAATGGRIHWQETFVSADKVFSVYMAPDEATLRQFSSSGPLPAGTIYPISQVVDLTSA